MGGGVLGDKIVMGFGGTTRGDRGLETILGEAKAEQQTWGNEK